MIPILYILTAVLLSLGFYWMAQVVIAFPSGKAVHTIQDIHGRRSLSQRFQDGLVPLARLFSKLFPMSEDKKRRLNADFATLNITQNPEDFVSKAKARSLLLALIGALFIPFGIPWLALLTAVIAVLAYFQTMQAIRKKVEAQHRTNEAELPRLTETLLYNLQDNRDLLAFCEKYRKVAGKAL